MKRLPEAVVSKFTELFVVLHRATDDMKLAGAEAYLMGDLSQVAMITEAYQKMQVLENEIKSVVNNFDVKSATSATDKAKFHPKDNYRTRKLGYLLRVSIADKIIQEATIKETFVRTLRAFGLDRVAKLNKVVTSVPLLARTPVNGYQNQRRCDGWYITTHVNMHTAKAVLEEIGKQLNVPVKVEFIDR